MSNSRATKTRKNQFVYKTIDKILERLDNPRKYGKGWRARCPAHDGNNPSTLSICETSDGTVLLHCFAQCTSLEVVHSLGLELSDLFERPPVATPGDRAKAREMHRRSLWRAAFEFLPQEITVVEIAAQQVVGGEPLSEADLLRVHLAYQRIKSAKEVLLGR